MIKLKFNPFADSATLNYDQFRRYKFIPFRRWEIIKNKINSQINQIKDNYFFGERLILLGQRGLGKTTSLFAIKEMLDSVGIRTLLFSRLIVDASHINTILNPNMLPQQWRETIESISEKPVYILIDFPDAFELKELKKFLLYLGELMIHKNYNKINFIFAMNISHYNKSFSYSETFGKFMSLPLEPLGLEETEALINSRLELVDETWETICDHETLNLIYSYSKGVPRNIISACNILIENLNGVKISGESSSRLLQERYVHQVINDRVEDQSERRIYMQMIDILKNDFGGRCDKQADYVLKINEKMGLGDMTVYKKIDALLKWGIFNYQKGGEKRRNKILSLN